MCRFILATVFLAVQVHCRPLFWPQPSIFFPPLSNSALDVLRTHDAFVDGLSRAFVPLLGQNGFTFGEPQPPQRPIVPFYGPPGLSGAYATASLPSAFAPPPFNPFQPIGTSQNYYPQQQEIFAPPFNPSASLQFQPAQSQLPSFAPAANFDSPPPTFPGTYPSNVAPLNPPVQRPSLSYLPVPQPARPATILADGTSTDPNAPSTAYGLPPASVQAIIPTQQTVPAPIQPSELTPVAPIPVYGPPPTSAQSSVPAQPALPAAIQSSAAPVYGLPSAAAQQTVPAQSIVPYDTQPPPTAPIVPAPANGVSPPAAQPSVNAQSTAPAAYQPSAPAPLAPIPVYGLPPATAQPAVLVQPTSPAALQPSAQAPIPPPVAAQPVAPASVPTDNQPVAPQLVPTTVQGTAQPTSPDAAAPVAAGAALGVQVAAQPSTSNAVTPVTAGAVPDAAIPEVNASDAANPALEAAKPPDVGASTAPAAPSSVDAAPTEATPPDSSETDTNSADASPQQNDV